MKAKQIGLYHGPDDGAQKNKVYGEAPELAARVQMGTLPAVEKRLPENPLVVRSWEETGTYGGTVRYAEINPRFCHYLRHINEAALLETGPSDRWHHYSRMDGPVLPGVLEKFESSADAREHTFWIRKGLRWSDGEPVTTRDVRYAVRDVLLHPEIQPFLTNSEGSLILMPEWEWLFWGDAPVVLEERDEYCFTLRFAQPYPAFITQQVRSARWQMLLRPFHYLRRFHKAYADPEELSAQMCEAGFGPAQWGAYYNSVDPAVREAGYFLPARIPHIERYPTLDPWVYEPGATLEHCRLTRNPYFYAVDEAGNQLPYISAVERTLKGNHEELMQHILQGKSDFAGCFLKLADQPILNKAGRQHDFSVLSLRLWQVQQVVYLINQCPEQEILRPILQDVRFRQAVSLCIDREKLVRELFLGKGEPSQATAGKDKPYFRPEFARSFARYDLEKANSLLDEMGLTRRTAQGMRVLPGDEVLELVYFQVTPPADEAAAHLKEQLAKIGLELRVIRLDHGSQMGQWQLRNRHVFGVWEMPGDDPLIPYQVGGLSDPVPLWWKWYESRGRQGVEPSEPGKKLYALRDRMKQAQTDEQRYALAEELYRLQAQQLWVIGIAADTPQLFVARNGLGNLRCAAEKGYFLSTALLGARQWYWKNAQKKAKID